VYPVNPTAKEILGYKCYTSVSAVPDPVDLAVVVVPAPSVADAVDECGRRGIRHVVVVSGGFAETGPDGAARERLLRETATKHRMRVVGPNCIGTIDTHTPVNTTFVMGMPAPGDIGFVSQSGAMVAAVIDWARGAAVGFSRIASLGNQVDVSETEMIASLASDPQTKVITSYLEGVREGRKFMQVAADAARRKPFIALKAGHSETGAKAVASHTGALAGSTEAYDAAFRDSGVLRAHTMEELFDWARALAWQPLPEGDRVAVLTNAGGPAILAIDALGSAGLRLAPLTDETREYLRPRIPAAGSLENPVDILAGSGPGTYAVALDALLSDPTVDAAIVIQAPQDWFLPTSLAEVVGEVAAAHHKPVLTSIMGLASVDRALEILHQKKIPNYAFPERAASTISAMIARQHWLRTAPGQPRELVGINHKRAAKALTGRSWDEVVASYGITVAGSKIAGSEDEAVTLAEETGFPVAMKVVSTALVHKSDAGGVALGVQDAGGVRASFRRLVDAVRSELPEAPIDGIVVQPMYGEGLDILVGVRRDDQFGPLVVVGSGGTEVELLRDIMTGLAPLTPERAEWMIDQTLAGKRLRGWRGSMAGDRNAVVEAMMRIGRLACDFPEISELELNPLRVFREGSGAVALDIRGTVSERGGEGMRQADLPGVALRTRSF
jgi:acetyltransferase